MRNIKVIFIITVITVLATFGINLDSVKAASSTKIEGGMIVGERTMLPMRSIFENLGASVQWDSATKEVTGIKGNHTIKLNIGSKSATVNGERKSLDVSPQIFNNTTYIPVRFVSEALGAEVKWEPSTSTVNISLDNKHLVVPISRSIPTQQGSGEAFNSAQKTFKIGNKNIRANILTVDMKNPKVELGVSLAHNKIGAVENLDSIAKRHHAKAAINGTFFNAYTQESFKQPYGFIMMNGKLMNNGDDRAVFAFDDQFTPSILSGQDFKNRSDEFIGAIQAGPTLVRDGKAWVHPALEGHSDPKILTNSGARSAIGITKDQKVILVTTNSGTIPELAQVMLQAGAVQAMNLDGGASSCLYFNGKYITPPGRQISNAILFYYK